MAITYVGGNSNVGTGSTISVDLTALTGGSNSSPSEGDLVVVIWGCGDTGNLTMTMNTSGYDTPLDLYQTETWDPNLGVASKFMGSTPDTTCVVNRSNNAAYGGAAVVQVWRGVDQTTRYDVTRTTATGSNASRFNPPAITPTTAGAVILAGGIGTQTTAGSAFTIPSGWNTYGISVKSDGTTSDAGVAIGSKTNWSSGAFDPAAVTGGTTGTSSGWIGVTIALRPAPTLEDVLMDAEAGSFSTTGSDATLNLRNQKLYYVIYPSAQSAPSAAQIKAGQNSSGASATASGWELARETTGEQIFASAASGLTAGTSYRVAFVWSDGTGDSNVVVSDAFSTTASATTMDAAAGSFSTTGAAAELVQRYRVNAESGTFSTSGAAASLYERKLLNAESTTFSTTGAAASLYERKRLNAEVGSYSTTGAAASFYERKKLNAEVGTYSTTGAAASLYERKRLNAEAGSYSTTGADATLNEITVLTLNAEVGSYSTVGADASFYERKRLNAEAGTYSTVGADASLVQRFRLNAESTTYATTGAAASLYQIYRVNAEAGAYSSAGAAATLLFNQLINAQAGTYTTTGSDATLNVLSVGTLNAEAGSYSTTGADGYLYQYRKLDATAGSYATTGADATLTKITLSALNAEAGTFSTVGADVTFVAPLTGYALNAESGEYEGIFAPTALYRITGELVKVHWFELEYTPIADTAAYPGRYVSSFGDIYSYHHRVLQAEAGSYETTGAEATLLNTSRIFSVDPGEYTTIGISATLTYFPGAIVFNAGAGSYSTTGGDARLRKKRRIKPIADVTITDWTPSTGTEVFPTINDLNTATYSSTTKLRKPVEVLLEDAVTINVLETHTVRYKLKGNGFNKTKVVLLDDGTVIATWLEYNVPPSETEFERTLTSTQLGQITDPANLRLRAIVKR